MAKIGTKNDDLQKIIQRAQKTYLQWRKVRERKKKAAVLDRFHDSSISVFVFFPSDLFKSTKTLLADYITSFKLIKYEKALEVCQNLKSIIKKCGKS